MKKIKIISALLSAALLAACFTSCDAKGGRESESETYDFDTPELAFEAMTDAAEKGDYSDALRCYRSGAADAKNSILVNNYYFYSMAADDYTKKGCIGYPLDIVNNHVEAGFSPAQKLQADLLTASRRLNGVYEMSDMYIYIIDGKIAASVGTQIPEEAICTDELVMIKDEFYWAKHNKNGEDELLYKLELSGNTLVVTTAESNTDDIFSGTYTSANVELPILYY